MDGFERGMLRDVLPTLSESSLLELARLRKVVEYTCNSVATEFGALDLRTRPLKTGETDEPQELQVTYDDNGDVISISYPESTYIQELDWELEERQHIVRSSLYAMYVLVDSHFERLFFDLVDHIHLCSPQSFGPRDLKGGEFDGYKKYLSKAVGINVGSGPWSKLTNYREVRHAIVHSLGDLSRTSEKRRRLIQEFANSNSQISLNYRLMININQYFIEEYLILLEEIFQDLETRIRDWLAMSVV